MAVALMIESKPAVSAIELVVCQNVDSPVSERLWQQWFTGWFQQLEFDRAGELSLCLTTDEEIRQLNHQFRGRDVATDVLAFPALTTDLLQNVTSVTEVDMPPSELIIGDIVISVPTAERQAREQEHSLSTELAWLATHGLLHLLGWDHPDAFSLRHMLQKQRELLMATQVIE